MSVELSSYFILYNLFLEMLSVIYATLVDSFIVSQNIIHYLP